MAGMNGFEPTEYRPRSHGYKWLTKDIVEAFLESDDVCVGKDFGDDCTKVYGAFRHYVKRHGVPVKVFRSGTVVGLLKEER